MTRKVCSMLLADFCNGHSFDKASSYKPVQGPLCGINIGQRRPICRSHISRTRDSHFNISDVRISILKHICLGHEYKTTQNIGKSATLPLPQ